jgi:Na+/alanine symporter
VSTNKEETVRFVYNCRTVVVPLLVIIVVAVVLFVIGQRDIAWAVSCLGTCLVLLGNLLYIAIWDSRSRWPGTTWTQRLTKVMWHER